jgi:peptide deformylase
MTKIVLYPNEVLRKKVTEVIEIDKVTKKEIEELKKLLAEGENAAGLAAPQIGVSKNFFGIKINGEVKIYFNPKLLKTWGERTYPVIIKDAAYAVATSAKEDFLEGCLSFPDYFGTVKRWLKIEVEWQELVEEKFVSKIKELEGFEAIVWQHESDHLIGRLFVDYIKKEGGKFYKWNGKEMVKAEIDEILDTRF